jgi:hypothetical protein
METTVATPEMPRRKRGRPRKTPALPTPTPIEPEIPKEPAMLTREELADEPGIQLRKHSREVLEKYWASVKSKLDGGDMRALEMVARTYQYDRGPGGITIFSQSVSLNNGFDKPDRIRSFDQIVAKLEERDAERVLIAQPDEIEDGDESDVFDAEVEDVQ